MFKKKISDILKYAELYHVTFYKASKFTGPSLYFHKRSLNSNNLSLSKLEYIYATLAAWGMHRMGPKGAKMVCFNQFKDSVNKLKKPIDNLQKKDISNHINKDEWNKLEQIFTYLNVMASNARLVGNSKAMHHMLPNLVPPIDREHTLKYLEIIYNKKSEWDMMSNILKYFFIPIVRNKKFRKLANEWMQNSNSTFKWDTSYMKIVDNLIIGERIYRESYNKRKI